MQGIYLGELCTILAAILWAISLTGYQLYAPRVSALSINLFKNFIALVVSTIALFCFTLDLPSQTHIWFWMFAAGAIGTGLGDLCLIRSMQLIGPQLATSIQLLVPVCSVLLGFVLLGESLSIVQLCGIALCLSGVYIIVAASRPAPKNRDEGKDGNGFRVGMIIAFCCTASFTFGMISMRIAAQEFDVWSGTVVKVVGANMFLLLLRPFLGRFLGDGNDQPIFAKERVAPVVLFSFIGSGLGLALLTAGGKYAYIGVVSTLASTPPLWLLPLSILFLGEKLSWAKMAGVAVAICGVLLVSVPFGYFWPY